MSISSYIKKVQQKPEKEKEILLLWWTIILTGIITLVWLFNLGLTMEQNSELQREAEAKAKAAIVAGTTTEDTKTASRSWSQIVGDNVGAIKEGWEVIVNQIK